MNKPIKGTFKTFHDYIKITGHNDKELDPKQNIRIKTDEKVLYLTFDTCPTNEVDYQILNWLVENKIPATIFLNIKWFKNNEDKNLTFLKSDQFEIGGHGFEHKRPTRQNLPEQRRDINRCVKFIKDELDRDVKWYRAPYGKPNEDTINVLEDKGISYASWAGHIFDKAAPDVENPNETALDYMKKYTMPGDIWIFHINKEGQNSFEILKEAYTWAIDNGYSFAKLS
jgi:peptidoglycan/xylan/chitin deacetylase (PgdA/CDA1 family)